MKTFAHRLTLIALFALASIGAGAQSLYTGYFSDGFLYRHDMNPAIGNDRGYVSFPALGNFNLSVSGSLGLGDVLYNVNGRTVTFMHPNVSTSEFLSHIHDNNKFNAGVRLQILGVGFKGFGGYNTIEINAREDGGFLFPGSVFHIMKEGLSSKTYDLSNFGAREQAYGEIALGHSRQVDEKLRVGAKVKVLAGLANIEARVDKAQLTFGEDNYSAVSNATVDMSINGASFVEKTSLRGPDNVPHTYVNDVEADEIAPNGFGLAVDLGAEYQLTDHLKLSAAILDLGFISWKHNAQASTNGDRHFSTDGYIFTIGDDDHDFDTEMERIGEDLAALYELRDNGDTGGRTTGLGATINLGAEYTLPAYDKLSFSALSTSRIMGKYSSTDFRLGANFTPAKIFTMSASVDAGTYGVGCGFMFSFHPKGFSLFMGMDRFLGTLAKQGVPLHSNAHLSLGLNFPF